MISAKLIFFFSSTGERRLAQDNHFTTKLSLLVVLLPLIFSAAAHADPYGGKGQKSNWERAWKIEKEGLTLEDSGDVDGAIKRYQQAISIYEFDSDFFYNLGNALTDKKDNKAAAINFEKSAEINPNKFDVWEALGEAYYDLKNLAASEHAYKKANQLQPTNYDILINIVHVLIDEGKVDEASVFLSKARAVGGQKRELDQLASTIRKMQTSRAQK